MKLIRSQPYGPHTHGMRINPGTKKEKKMTSDQLNIKAMKVAPWITFASPFRLEARWCAARGLAVLQDAH